MASPLRLYFASLTVALVGGATADVLYASDPVLATIDTHPPAVAASGARKALPPLDCWRCSGPAVCAPCFPTHHVFLYYNTYPWDDDPVNEFDDCLRGNCGNFGVHRALHWMKFRGMHHR